MSSSGRTALVTGGNRGLGAAIARALDDAGHRVIITHTPGNDKVAAWLDAQDTKGYRFVAYGVDVGDWESTQALARQIQADGYHVDILVNNAGITRDATLRKMDKSGWDAVLRTNLDSMFNVTKPFIDPMVEPGWGRIVNVSSVTAVAGNRGQVNYAAAKGGLHAASRSLALELASRGVTVNVVAPGIIDSGMAEGRFGADALRQMVPMQRAGRPEEVAELVEFLASERAAYITGQVISINGGMA